MLQTKSKGPFASYKVNFNIELKRKSKDTNRNLYSPWDSSKTLITCDVQPISYALRELTKRDIRDKNELAINDDNRQATNIFFSLFIEGDELQP